MKVGDKVVYIGGCKDVTMKCPKVDTEICEIVEMRLHWSGCISHILSGYETADDGVRQGFGANHIRKVAPKEESAISDLSEEGLERLKEEQNDHKITVPQRVLSFTEEF